MQLIDAINNGLGKRAADQATRLPIGPSSFHKCPRQIALALAGTPTNERPTKDSLMLEYGTAIGELLETAAGDGFDGTTYDLFVQMPAHVPVTISPDELPLIEEALRMIVQTHKIPEPYTPRLDADRGLLFLPGTLDVAAIGPGKWGKTLYVWDIKSTHSWAYKQVASGKEPPSPSYVTQVYAYAVALLDGMHDAKDIKAVQCALLYVDRSSGDMTEVDISTTVERMRENVQWAANGSVVEGMIAYVQGLDDYASVPYSPDDGGRLPWQCTYCPFGPKAGRCFPSVEAKPRNGRLDYYVTD